MPRQCEVKFGDVAGCDGAKTELVEVVDFLKNASRSAVACCSCASKPVSWWHEGSMLQRAI